MVSFSRYYLNQYIDALHDKIQSDKSFSNVNINIHIHFSFIFQINRKWNITWKWEEKLSQLVFLEVYIFISLCINLDDVKMSSRWRWNFIVCALVIIFESVLQAGVLLASPPTDPHKFRLFSKIPRKYLLYLNLRK